MLRLFKAYYPYQYALLGVLLVVIRLPLLALPLPLLTPELNWMLVGERMAEGHLLYRDIWDNLSPLSAVVYWGIDEVLGRSPEALQLLAALVSLWQIMYFNYVTNVRDVFSDRTFWPGLFYLLFMHMSYDCLTLSPVLMSTSFLLLAFGALIRQLERRGVTDEVFEIGFYLGVAALFYLPVALFILWALVVLFLYTGASFRQHSLMVFGFLFPLAVVVLVFYLQNALPYFNRNLLTTVFRIRQYSLTDVQTLIISLLLPLGFGLMGFLSLLRGRNRYVNRQQYIQQIMLIWVITAALTLGLSSYLAPMSFLVFIPPLAYYAVYYVENSRRFWVAETVFVVVAGLMMVLFYQSALGLIRQQKTGWLATLQLPSSPLPPAIRGKRVLMLGDNLAAYQHNRQATPYLNWEMAQYDFDDLDNYEAVQQIYTHFEADLPDYILDPHQVMPKLFVRVPLLAIQYTRTQQNGLYQRKKP